MSKDDNTAQNQNDQPKDGEFLPANLKELKPFSAVEAELAALKIKNATVFDYNTPKGNAEARSHVHSIRLVKGRLGRAKKEAKADALEYGRMLDREEARIEAELEALIEVHAKPLKDLEEKEAQRKLNHETTLVTLQDLVRIPHGAPSSQIEEALQKARDFTIDDRLDEFQERATNIKAATTDALEQMLVTAKQREAEQAELARHREAEANRQRIAGIEQRIAALRVTVQPGDTEQTLNTRLKQLEQSTPTVASGFDELLEKAVEAHDQSKATLREAIGIMQRVREEQEEQERQRKAEEQRVAAIRESIKVLQVVALASDTPELIQIRIDNLDGALLEPDQYAEFAEEAKQTYTDARAALVAAQEAAHRRVEQEQENARLRREQLKQERHTSLLGKIVLYRHSMPAPNDNEHIIAQKQARLLTPTEAEFGELFTDAKAAWQETFDALVAARKKIMDDRKAAEDRAAEEKREKSKRHRNKIHNAAAVAILDAMTNAPDPDAIAHAIVEAIAAGKVPAVSITY